MSPEGANLSGGGCGDANWPDLLTAFNGKSITYDAIGNPLSDGTWTYSWQHGRQLASMSASGSSIAYGYNADGKRISKTVNGTTYNFSYLGDTLTDPRRREPPALSRVRLRQRNGPVLPEQPVL